MRMKDIYMPSDHYRIYGEYIPYEDEHVETWTDDNGIEHAEIVCNHCGETRYVKEKSPMAKAIIWRPTYHEGKPNGCTCQQASKNRTQRRRDEFNSTPEYMISETGEKILVRKTQDFLLEHMFDFERNTVAQNSRIPSDVVTARINDRSFMKDGFSYLALKELRRICDDALVDGIVTDRFYITGKGKCEKTRTLFALRNAMLEGTIDAVFTNVDQIASLILSNSKYVGTLMSARCLLIDDIGKRELSKTAMNCVVNFLKALKQDSHHYCILAGIPLDEVRRKYPELYNAVARITNNNELVLNDNNVFF